MREPSYRVATNPAARATPRFGAFVPDFLVVKTLRQICPGNQFAMRKAHWSVPAFAGYNPLALGGISRDTNGACVLATARSSLERMCGQRF